MANHGVYVQTRKEGRSLGGGTIYFFFVCVCVGVCMYVHSVRPTAFQHDALNEANISRRLSGAGESLAPGHAVHIGETVARPYHLSLWRGSVFSVEKRNKHAGVQGL